MKSAVDAGEPSAAASVLEGRTLANSHPALLPLLRPGLAVLDVGCGPGTLTAEIARRVAPGPVVGMDASPEIVSAAEAASPPGRHPNLIFYAGDVCESQWREEFDLANAARVLQWVADPARAVRRMARAVKPGGRLLLAEVDHGRARWSPEPEGWTRFYASFLDWRAGRGLDNGVAGRLPALARAAGLVDLQVAETAITAAAGEARFFRVAGRWRPMIESHGRKMVAAGCLTERERRAVLGAYARWMQEPAAVHTIREVCVVGRRPLAADGRGPGRSPGRR